MVSSDRHVGTGAKEPRYTPLFMEILQEFGYLGRILLNKGLSLQPSSSPMIEDCFPQQGFKIFLHPKFVVEAYGIPVERNLPKCWILVVFGFGKAHGFRG